MRCRWPTASPQPPLTRSAQRAASHSPPSLPSPAPSGFSWEIIVVDDGSSDATSAAGQRYADAYGTDRIRVLRLAQNVGKGGAVRKVRSPACRRFAAPSPSARSPTHSHTPTRFYPVGYRRACCARGGRCC